MRSENMIKYCLQSEINKTANIIVEKLHSLKWLVRTTVATSHNYRHNRFTALFPGPPGWAGASRELLDFMVQGKINRGKHTDHLARRHSIRTKQCPPPPCAHVFYMPDAIPAAQPTASKHWRQL